jgi:site-specific recombinase XerD
MMGFGLLFYLKKRKGYVSGEIPIYMRITVGGLSKEICVNKTCGPLRWNSGSRRVDGEDRSAWEINACLDALQAKVFSAREGLIQDGTEVTAGAIRDLVCDRVVPSGKTRRIMEIFKVHNEQMAALVGVEYTDGTMERYTTSLKHTKSFLEWKFKVSDMDIRKLNYEFITEYEFWLKSVRRCNHNTTMKYLSNFRKIVGRCIKNGWLQRDPFYGFRMAKREVEREALTDMEVQAISVKVFGTIRLAQVRDVFLFSCYTGLAYVDVQKLRRWEITEGVDGELWIFTKRKKTNSSSRVPILPAALEIMQRYADHPRCVARSWVLPVLCNQKMNAYLKEIADLCGIRKNLTFHIARHTFATTITLNNDVPMETVSKMLGHRNLKTTQQYAKILDRKVSEDMQLLKEKLGAKG